jgi:uncharacterized membrane protein YhaH (DUF805 family)
MRHALDLFSWNGQVSRRAYVLAGLLLLILKYPLDLMISRAFGMPWNPLMYVAPRVSPLWRTDLHTYWTALLLVALPFIWAGLSLSARRLRDMGGHPFWAGLFFLPFLHWAFFLVLAVAPPHRPAPPHIDGGPYRENTAPPIPTPAPPRLLARAIPRSDSGAFLFGLVLSLAFGLGAYVVAVQVHQSLGIALFVGVPFAMGFFQGFAVTYHTDGSCKRAVGYGVAPYCVALVALIALGWEGVACIVMAFPLLGGVSALGAWVGWLCARDTRVQALGMVACLVLVPGLLGADIARPPLPVSRSVVSQVTIQAPPEVVWKNVVSFPPIQAPPAPIFAIVAMPLEARIEGRDPGALRRCVFTSGEFEEPIEVWNEPRELRFGVRAQPPQLSPYLDVRRGQFLLTRNGDGSTTLTGTTWYDLRVHPVAYWSSWADTFLHAIHLRVLTHIQRLSEHPEAAHEPVAEMPAWLEMSHATCRCTRHPTP